MSSFRLVFSNGVVSRSSDTPPVATFLESHPGAYTTTRTHDNASCLLFWERHLRRLANSARILLNSKPRLLFKPYETTPHCSLSSFSIDPSVWISGIPSLVNDSMSKALKVALRESRRSDGEELAVTALVSCDVEKFYGVQDLDGERVDRVFDVNVHIGTYVPGLFGVEGNGAHLALVGYGREVAVAKYSDWVRLRKPLEKLRPPLVTELLLSNDGDHILEGCITNFFVVCQKDNSEAEGRYSHECNSTYSFEVQTAPISDGVLPGVIRELVIEVCLSEGIPIREIAPSWSKFEFWEEAFITSKTF
ncbi:uncharacterized protein LOC110824162 isoform X2 [Carica papaya]|uniref:uncharacterized protein LOC110824162 isoform X2 n=1 Tax=Carica papaya TaxID=3649 RepID=UPI000B8CF887|nr:uncharacterized protein LOC110824162 isoform X2 [Carica papaya]